MPQTIALNDYHKAKGIEFFLRDNVNIPSKNYVNPDFVYIKNSDAESFIERNMVEWGKQVNGKYETVVKEWLLAKNIPAVYEIRFVLGDKYIHNPDFITGLMTDDNRLVLINPHNNVNRKFLDEQRLLQSLGFYTIIMSKKSQCHLENSDGIKVADFTDEYWHVVPENAGQYISSKLDRTLKRMLRISKEELLDRLSNMDSVDFMLGATFKFVYPGSRH